MTKRRKRRPRPQRRIAETVAETAGQAVAEDGSERPPKERRRSQRQRPPPRVNLAASSSSDETSDVDAVFNMPRTGDVVRVCYIDMNDEDMEDADAAGKKKVEWWSATVVSVLAMMGSEDVRCVANVSFWPAHGQPRQECSVLFMTNGLVIDFVHYNSDKENSSEWSYVKRVAETAEAALLPGSRRPAPRSSQEDHDGRASGRRSRARARPARARDSRDRTSTPSGRAVPELEVTVSLHGRASQVEAAVKVMNRRQFIGLEVAVVKEIRVETKLGLIAALRRSPGPLHVTDGGPQLEAVIEGGTMRWSYKCAMGRYKMLAAAAHVFFCEGANKRPSAVQFNPSFDTLDGVSGFGSSEITFATAMDMFRFLGISSAADMKRLMTYAYEATGGRHLRVLGGMQDGWRGDVPTLAMFVGHSCVRDSEWLHVADVDEGVAAENLFFANASWDSDNSCFAADATLQKSATGYKEIASVDCSCFKLRWETEPPKVQRTVGHISIDTEGVRKGTMVVEMPYYRLAPYLASVFNALCSDDTLENIIRSTP